MIILQCPLSGIVSRTISSNLDLTRTELDLVLTLPIEQLNTMSQNNNLTQVDKRLLFCAYSLQAGLLTSIATKLQVSTAQITTYLDTVKSLANYIKVEPNFSSKLPKYSPNGKDDSNFVVFLETCQGIKSEYKLSRNNLRAELLNRQEELNLMDNVDAAKSNLGMLASRYASKLKLTEQTSNNFSIGKQLATNLIVAATSQAIDTELNSWYLYILTAPVSTLHNDVEVKEIDLIDTIELIENWDTSLNIKFAVLPFLRNKLTKYNTYSGRRISKLDAEELTFLLGEIEMKVPTGAGLLDSIQTNNLATTDTTNTLSTADKAKAMLEAIKARKAQTK